MSRQHATPVLLSADGTAMEPLVPLTLGGAGASVSEANIQALIHAHPALLPIAEVDAAFIDAVAICRELSTSAGPIDNLLLTPGGLPVLVECKLWRNPQARREVVGQILDYAKELSRWSSADLEREVRARCGPDVTLIGLLEAAGHAVDEAGFHDALTRNLRRGRVLLLIVGDGIREGVEAIVDYVQARAGLHFSLGLVELPFFQTGDGRRLITPRIIARTEVITRTVVATPEGYVVQAAADPDDTGGETVDEGPLSRIGFWRDFVRGLLLDDPEQERPRAGNNGFVTMVLPGDGRNVWLNIYRNVGRSEVGVSLAATRNSLGERLVERVIEDWPAVRPALGGDVAIETLRSGQRRIWDSFTTGPWTEEGNRRAALTWLQVRVNDFVNVLRPRIRSAAADMKD